MNNGIKRKPNPRSGLRSALLLSIAVLMMLVSCPLKRMLLANPGAHSSSGANAFQKKQQAVHYSSTSCCALKYKHESVKPLSTVQHVPDAPQNVEHTIDSGSLLQYYLTGISNKPVETVLASTIPLPIFLRYRRLLV